MIVLHNKLRNKTRLYVKKIWNRLNKKNSQKSKQQKRIAYKSKKRKKKDFR